MRTTTTAGAAALVICLLLPIVEAFEQCRCVPSSNCWPTQHQWKTLNASIDGQLVADQPVAISCYPGPAQDAARCAVVDQNWTNNTFQQLNLGYSYPTEITCPPVNASAGDLPAVNCTLGNDPVFTINATKIEHITAALAFAQQHNLRLVIRDTGHDILGRSSGFGSLQIWIRYLRTGITFHEKFEQPGSSWNGSAFTIGGGYTWADVYPEAAKRGKIVVGGGTPSVGCLGGWMQGGGHGPASHDFGLGADQVLEAKVVLASGQLVTASPTSNADLFFAIRGGGPGAYKIVVETTIKAWPTSQVVAQVLSIVARNATTGREVFLDALADLYGMFPSLTASGWSGYGSWSIANVEGPPIAYSHAFANFRKSPSDAETAFEPTLAKLEEYNTTGSLDVSISYAVLPTYAEYYSIYSGVEPPAGSLSALTSRFLDTTALTSNATALRQALEVVAGTSDEYTVQAVEVLGGANGQIAKDGQTSPVSGLTPAWRSMILHHITARGWLVSTPADVVAEIQQDITYRKGAALKRLAPGDAGCYMNEANRLDPQWRRDFYGGQAHYEILEKIKRRHDPLDLLYCPTCVGSERWTLKEDGRLCRR